MRAVQKGAATACSTANRFSTYAAAGRADDPAALDVAARLGDAGFEPVVVGPLARARSFDPGTPVYNTGMSGAELARALGGARSP